MKGTLLLVSSVGLLLPGVGSCPMKCLCHPSSNSVDCSGQGLSKVPRDLPPWTVTLLLQDNRIHWLPALAFQSVSLLSTLNLSNNSLSNLAAEAFYGLPHLRVLNVTQKFPAFHRKQLCPCPSWAQGARSFIQQPQDPPHVSGEALGEPDCVCCAAEPSSPSGS